MHSHLLRLSFNCFNLLKNQLPRSLIKSIDVQCFNKYGTHRSEFHHKIEQLSKIEKLLKCDADSASRIYEELPSIRNPWRLPQIEENINVLRSCGVSSQSIIDNASILILPTAYITDKLSLLMRAKPSKMDDILALIDLEPNDLKKMKTDLIYYFSEQLKVEPGIVSKSFVKYPYLLRRNSLQYKRKLDLFLDYKVPADKILQCFNLFAYSHQRLASRLESLKTMAASGIEVNKYTFQFSEKEFMRYTKNKGTSRVPQMLKESILDRKNEEVIQWLEGHLKCSRVDALRIYYEYPALEKPEILLDVKETIELLIREKISTETITNNSFLLKMQRDELQKKLDILSGMKPKQLGDFVPLAALSLDELERAKINSIKEAHLIPEPHRIYFFSELLQIDPQTGSKYFAQFPRVLFLQFNGFKKKLSFVLSLGISSESILATKSYFLSSEKTMQEKFTYLKENGVQHIKSYMLCESPSRLKEIIERSTTDLDALSGCDSIVDYLSERLSWDHQTAEDMQKKYPMIFKSRARRIKEHLDYLLIDQGFTAEQISRHMQIMCADLDEIKTRVNEYKSFNCKIKGLGMLTLSNKRYVQAIKSISRNTASPESSFINIEKRIKEKKSFLRF